MLEVKHLTVGMVGTNCYVAANQMSKEAGIIDPGDEAKRIDRLIKENGYEPQAILLTHGHFDHVMAVDALSAEYGLKVFAHELERETLEDPEMNVSGMMGRTMTFHATDYVRDGELLNLAGYTFQVLLTPGHTRGGVCYYLASENVLFSGDTLFAGSVGRTDFPGGSMGVLVGSIREKLLTLPDETIVYPGHMESTTIGAERTGNMFL